MFPSRLITAALVALMLFSAPARAGLTLLRDADIEYSLSRLAAPVLQAAGLSPSSIRILVVNDGGLNAFVVDTSHIFLNAGLIQRLDGAAELQAVIAHEAAHISNGHITRRLGNLRVARTAAGLGLVLAAAAAAAGSGDAAAGLAIGSQSSALRLFLSHTRAEESSADISSVRYLVRAGIDPAGAVRVQELFRGQEVLAVSRQDPYMRTHPLSRDRYRALQGLVAGHALSGKRDPASEYWFARAQGKLSAFRRAPSWTLRRADDSLSDDIRRMREAVAHHRQSDTTKALRAIDRAIALRGSDPFYTELKGQIQLEARRFGAAVQTYGSAAKAAPRQPLILAGYGRALLANGRPQQALGPLEAARARDFSNARLMIDLAQAYAQTGRSAMASLVTAERYALQGRFKDAELHAKRASDQLARGSGPWKRAQDILIAAERANRR